MTQVICLHGAGEALHHLREAKPRDEGGRLKTKYTLGGQNVNNPRYC